MKILAFLIFASTFNASKLLHAKQLNPKICSQQFLAPFVEREAEFYGTHPIDSFEIQSRHLASYEGLFRTYSRLGNFQVEITEVKTAFGIHPSILKVWKQHRIAPLSDLNLLQALSKKKSKEAYNKINQIIKNWGLRQRDKAYSLANRYMQFDKLNYEINELQEFYTKGVKDRREWARDNTFMNELSEAATNHLDLSSWIRVFNIRTNELVAVFRFVRAPFSRQVVSYADSGIIAENNFCISNIPDRSFLNRTQLTKRIQKVHNSNHDAFRSQPLWGPQIFIPKHYTQKGRIIYGLPMEKILNIILPRADIKFAEYYVKKNGIRYRVEHFEGEIWEPGSVYIKKQGNPHSQSTIKDLVSYSSRHLINQMQFPLTTRIFTYNDNRKLVERSGFKALESHPIQKANSSWQLFMTTPEEFNF